MSNNTMIHIKTAEGLFQVVMHQIEMVEPQNSTQAEAQEDLVDAINEIQSKELLAFRNACELQAPA